MANISKCANEIHKSSDGLIGKDEAEKIINELRARAEKKRTRGDTRPLDQILMAEGRNIFQKATVEAKIRKRNALKQIAAVKRERKFLGQFPNKFKGLKAILGGDSQSYKGAKNSIDANQKAIKMQLVGGLAQDLETDGVLTRFNSGEMDADIADELWNLSSETGKSGSTGNKDALKAAKSIHKWQRYSVDRQNRAGAWIRDLDGYIVRQSHDMDKIRRAGLDQWLDDIMPRLSDKTFEKVLAGKERDYLEGVYKALVTGIHRGHGSKHFEVGKAMATAGNIARSVSQERLLHFKTSGDWFSYNKDYGKGNVREAVFSGLEHSSEGIGLMERLGPDPHRTFEILTDEVMQELETSVAAGDKVARKQLRKIQGGRLKSIMAEVDGTTRVPVTPGAGRWQSNIRAIQTMSKLGGATLSSITDLPAAALELQYQGHNILSSWSTSLKTLFKGRGNKEQRDIARLLGVAMDGMLGEVYARFSAEDSLSGKTAGLMHTYFKLNLQNWWNDSFRSSVGLMMSSHLATASKKSFSAIDDNLKRILRMYDLDESNWSLIQKMSQKTSDGNEFVTPNLAQELSDLDVKTALKNRNATENEIKSFKDKLETNMRSYFVDRADHAVPTPGANERAFMLMGTQPGEVLGEVARFFWQFKSFPLTFLSKLYGREISGRVDINAPKSFFGIAHGGSASMAGLTQMMVGATVFGFMAKSLKDIAKGKEPIDLSKQDDAQLTKTMFASMAQGGGLGLYGDFMFGEFDRFGKPALESLAGPTIATFGSMAELFSAFRQDVTTGDGRAASKAVRLAMNNSGILAYTPYIGKVSMLSNLFYTRLGMDHLFLYQMQENMNPGFLRRMERNLRRQTDQEFFIPPR